MTAQDDIINDQEIRDWLLRQLDVQRSAAIEHQLFVDRAFADRIDAVECDLIDDCAHGRLPAATARIVHMHDAWRIRFAKALAELQRPTVALVPQRARMSALRRVGFGTAIAASLLLTVVVSRWKAVIPVPTEQTVQTALPVITLLAGQGRGAAAPIYLPAREGDVRVQAEIGDYSAEATSRYELSVDAEGRVLFVAHGLAARTIGPYRFVEVAIPAAVLGPEVRRVIVAKEGAQDSSTASWDVQVSASR